MLPPKNLRIFTPRACAWCAYYQGAGKCRRQREGVTSPDQAGHTVCDRFQWPREADRDRLRRQAEEGQPS